MSLTNVPLPLPPEISQHALLYLSPVELATFSASCRSAYTLVYPPSPSDNFLWRNLYLQQFDHPGPAQALLLDGKAEDYDWKTSLQRRVQAEIVARSSSVSVREEDVALALETFIEVLQLSAPCTGTKSKSKSVAWLTLILSSSRILSAKPSPQMPSTHVSTLISSFCYRMRSYLPINYLLSPNLPSMLEDDEWEGPGDTRRSILIAEELEHQQALLRKESRSFTYDLRNYRKESLWGPYHPFYTPTTSVLFLPGQMSLLSPPSTSASSPMPYPVPKPVARTRAKSLPGRMDPNTIERAINWAHVSHIVRVVSANLAELPVWRDTRPPVGLEAARAYSAPQCRMEANGTRNDWAGVAGSWRRYVCFMDYRDLFAFNFANPHSGTRNPSFFDDPAFMEATRLIELSLSLVDPSSSSQLAKEYSQLDEGLAGLGGPESRREGRRKCQELPASDEEGDDSDDEYPSSEYPGSSKGERPARQTKRKDSDAEDAGDPYPPLFFRGLSKGVHGNEATVLGSVRMGSDAVVRWRFVRKASVYDGQTQWSSEGIQLGNIGSAMGIVGTWTGARHENGDPVGPFWLWKVAEDHPSHMDEDDSD